MRGLFPVPVFMYHDLANRSESVSEDHRPYVIPADGFREHLRILKEDGFTGGRLDALLSGGSGAAAGARRCVLTFDDGHDSNCTLALPLLLEAGFGATFFVTAGWIGRPPYLSWEQLRALAAAGMEIGSHSMTHRAPVTLTTAELRAEMADSRKLLEDRLGLAVVSASSPTGFFDPRMIDVVRDAGYRALCVGRIALWRDRREDFRIPRLPVKQRTPPADFRRMALGDRWIIARMRGAQMTRNGLKSALGVRLYRGLRRVLLEARGRRARRERP